MTSLIKEHHEGYITWEEYEWNQKIVTNNANMKGAMVRGFVRKGQALLGGLIHCSRCGRKMLAHYGGKVRGSLPMQRRITKSWDFALHRVWWITY